MEKNHKKIILSEAISFLLQIIFSNVAFLKMICPFGLPFALVRTYFGGNIFCILFAYMVSKLNSFVVFSDLFICFYEIVIITLFYFAKNLAFSKKPLLTIEIFSTSSTALALYYALILRQDLFLFLIDLLLKILLTAFFFKFMQIFKRKFLFFKFSNLDYFYFSLMTLFISLGIYNFGLNSIKLDYFVAVLIISIACKILPNEKFFILSLTLGIGATLASKNSCLLLMSAICSVVLVNVKEKNKFVFALAMLVSNGLTWLCSFQIDLISILISCAAALIIIIVPTNIINKFAALFEIDSLNLMCESLRKEKLALIKKKLKLMSDTLKNMQKDLKFLLVGKISHEKACIELSQDLINSCCKNCENFTTCFLQNINKRSMFESLLSKAIQNGKVTIDDVVVGLQSYCNKERIIVSEINQIAGTFLQFEKAMKNEDSSKLIIADELGNFSDMFLSFSKSVKLELGYNKIQSNQLKENLLRNLIDVKEVAIVENETGIESINMIAQNEHILKQEAVMTISKFAKNKFKLASVDHLNFSGLGFASFVPCEKLLMNVAVATKAKENKNGDNIAMTKLSQNRYFIAIADGMGHGENAGRISSMVLSLIKSMFEIGFDDELIIQSINKLLIPAGIDNFSSLDACVIDLQRESCTFVKLGASVSVLKHQNTSEVIACSSLPIGIINNISPTITRKHLSVNDIIFLASDGIVDSFSSIDDYKNYLNDAKIYNLQKFADDLLFDASFQNKKHPDDMSLIAINLLKKN